MFKGAPLFDIELAVDQRVDSPGRSVPFASPEQQSVIHVRSVFTFTFPAREPVLLVALGPADITARDVTFGHRRCAIRADRGQPSRRSSYLDMSIGAPDQNGALTSILQSKNVELGVIRNRDLNCNTESRWHIRPIRSALQIQMSWNAQLTLWLNAVTGASRISHVSHRR